MKIVEYEIRSSLEIDTIETCANALIEDGWQPFGTILFDGAHYHQAMVKYEEKAECEKCKRYYDFMLNAEEKSE